MLRCSSASRNPLNPRYGGLARVVPWSQEEVEQGFDDPYVFGDFSDATGLIPTRGAAQAVVRRFIAVHRAGDLDRVYVQQTGEEKTVTSTAAGIAFLGFDVAGPASPFWSIVVDFPDDAAMRPYLQWLNEHGLFSSADEAAAYLTAYRAFQIPDHDLPLVIWRIHRA